MAIITKRLDGNYETDDLVKYVAKSEYIDESGDASLVEFMKGAEEGVLDNWTINELLTFYLVWANGLTWKEFLDNAKQGDRP